MASFTVRIFSASSSGISMSKASSKAITSSTVSRESAPRSPTKEALGVTSPSSTPSCSTIICFTLSSAAAIVAPSVFLLNSRLRARLLFYRLGIPLNIVNRVLDRDNFLCFLIRYLDIKGLFQRHDQLHAVQRIGPQIVDERGRRRHIRRFHTQLVHNDLSYLFLNCGHLLSCCYVKPVSVIA